MPRTALRIRHVGSTFTRYPVAERGAFACSDEHAEPLVGHGPLHACGCACTTAGKTVRRASSASGSATRPSSSWSAQAAFGPDVNALNRQFLRHCAESQRNDGLTQMFAPGDHRTNGLLIPDWTLQWILNAEQHYLYTAELDVIEAIFPAIERALQWFAHHIDANGLVADLPHWHFHDWAALGRHGEAATLNAELAGALRAAARLGRRRSNHRARARRLDGAGGSASPPRSTRVIGTRRAACMSTASTRQPAHRTGASRSTPTPR